MRNEIEVIFYELEFCGDGCCSSAEVVDRYFFTRAEINEIWPNIPAESDDSIFPSEIPETFTDIYPVEYYVIIRNH